MASDRSPTTYISRSVDDTVKIGLEIGRSLTPGSIVALDGPLGSGKTVLAKGIGKALDVREEITSPTFIIISSYCGRLDLNHIDLYRINTAEELEQLGIEDVLWGGGVSVIEWAEKATEVLPDDTLWVRVQMHSDFSRTIRLSRNLKHEHTRH